MKEKTKQDIHEVIEDVQTGAKKGAGDIKDGAKELGRDIKQEGKKIERKVDEHT